MKYTKKELWSFVYRANTYEKISIAEKWLRDDRHFEMIKNAYGVELWDDLMMSLAYEYREINREENIRRLQPKYRSQYQ